MAWTGALKSIQELLHNIGALDSKVNGRHVALAAHPRLVLPACPASVRRCLALSLETVACLGWRARPMQGTLQDFLAASLTTLLLPWRHAGTTG